MPASPRPYRRGVDSAAPWTGQPHHRAAGPGRALGWAGFLFLCWALCLTIVCPPAWAALMSSDPMSSESGTSGPDRILPRDQMITLGDSASPGAADPIPLFGHMAVLADPDGTVTLEDLLQGKLAERFRRITGDVGQGYVTGHVWVRIIVQRPPLSEDALAGVPPGDQGHLPWIMELGPLYLEHLDAYSVSGGHVSHSTFGDSAPADGRWYKGREFLLPLIFDGSRSLTVYLDIHSATSIALQGQVAPAHASIHHVSLQALGLGGLLGIAIAMMAANLVYALWLKDRNSLVYCAYIANLIVLTVSSTNLLVELMPAAAPRLTSLIHGAALALTLVTATAMVNTMLNLRKTFPLIYRLSWPLAIIPGLIGTGVTLAGHFRDIAPVYNVLMLVMLMLVIGCALRLAARGNRVALLMVLSFFPSCLVAIIGALSRLRLAPYIASLDDWFGLVGALHMALMNFAIAYRIRQLEIDRREALAAALNASQNAGQQAKDLVTLRTRELAASNSQLSKALAAERLAVKEQLQFIDMVSHEYRTPVAILRTAIDVLFLHADTAMEHQPTDLLSRMRRAVDRLVEIIEVGLRLEGPQSAALSMQSSPIDLRATIADAVQAALQGVPDRTVKVQGPESLTILGDADLLKTAVMNVLSNALKYSRPSSPVWLDIVRANTIVQIRVRDEGPGIPAADQERVFQKFVRLSQTQRVPGTGLGLFMVRRIAELHGGRAYIDPEYTQGCCMIIDLPRKADGKVGDHDINRVPTPI